MYKTTCYKIYFLKTKQKKVVSKGWIFFRPHSWRVQRQASGDTSLLEKHLAWSKRKKKKQRSDLIPQRDGEIIFEAQRELARISLIFAGRPSIGRRGCGGWLRGHVGIIQHDSLLSAAGGEEFTVSQADKDTALSPAPSCDLLWATFIYNGTTLKCGSRII